MNAYKSTKKHINMVSKLAKDPAIILTSLNDSKCHLLHMLDGIMDEYFELQIAIEKSDKVNVLEELGDLLFYTEGLALGQEEHVREIKYVPLTKNETYQMLARVVKRHVFYEQDLNVKELVWSYKNLLEWIKYDASQYAFTMQQVQEANMYKLAKRFPNWEYTDTRAKERVDKAEGEDDTKSNDDDLGELDLTKACQVGDETCESCQ